MEIKADDESFNNLILTDAIVLLSESDIILLTALEMNLKEAMIMWQKAKHL